MKGIEGNVVLTGEVTAAGDVAGLQVLASSAPELTSSAVEAVSQWKYKPATENGRPIPITLNAVVHFRKDARARIGPGSDPGTMPSPIVGNLILSPAGPLGESKRLEGFPLEPGDGSVSGTLDLDLPKIRAARTYRVVVKDAFPSGRQVTLLDQGVPGGGTAEGYTVTLSFHRAVNPGDPAERGRHLVSVTVEGKDAGGGVYRVAGKSGGEAAKKKK